MHRCTLFSSKHISLFLQKYNSLFHTYIPIWNMYRSTYSYISLYPLYKVEKVQHIFHVSEKARSCHFMLTNNRAKLDFFPNNPFLCLQPKHSSTVSKQAAQNGTLTIGTKPEPFFREVFCPMSASHSELQMPANL